MIKAYVIRIDGQEESVDRLKKSIEKTESDIELNIFEGTTPKTIESHLEKEFTSFDTNNYNWNWPKDPSENHMDIKTGILKTAYVAANQEKKEACSISHMRLWDLCVSINEPIIIFEADAVLTRKFDVSELEGYKLVGLNDPRGATRRAALFHQIVSSTPDVQQAPRINEPGEMSPQGIAGNSAYYIEPDGASMLLEKVKDYGMWPNDAYMCRELFPWIRVVYPYYTKVQGTVSTTTR